MESEASEVLSWVYVTAKILFIVALVVFGGLEAMKYRRRQMERRNGPPPEDGERDAPEDNSEEPKGG